MPVKSATPDPVPAQKADLHREVAVYVEGAPPRVVVPDNEEIEGAQNFSCRIGGVPYEHIGEDAAGRWLYRRA